MIFEFTGLGPGSADGGDQRLEDSAGAMSADPETVKHRETKNRSQVDCRLGEGFNRVD